MKTKNNNRFIRFSLLPFVLPFAVSNALAAQTNRVSLGPAGVQGNDRSMLTAMSADGRYVAFRSNADNLVNGDTNGKEDAFIRDTWKGVTTRVSISTTGTQGNGDSHPTAVSADGRYVVFGSTASNLVAGDTNGYEDAFIRDTAAGTTTRISLGKNGVEGNQASIPTAISADGRYVLFQSLANNLVANDSNGASDAFVRDRLTSVTKCVSADPQGVPGNSESFPAAISADGRYVAFGSFATNLVGDDTNYKFDAFVRDTLKGVTKRASLGPGGAEGNANSQPTAISADGRYVAFWSLADNLVNQDANGYGDAFVRDMQAGATTLVSLGKNGVQGDGISTPAAISADGRYVAFESKADNLVAGDTNYIWSEAFVRDRVTGVTTRIGVATSGAEGDSESLPVAISADGRYIGFSSYSTNLVPGDTNYTWDAFVRDNLLAASKNADLQISVTGEPASVPSGQIAQYTLKVKNNGPDSATNVALTDIVFNGAVTGIAPTQGKCSKAPISVCRLGNLAAGASATVKVSIKAAGDPLKQQASVNAAPKDSPTSNNAVKISTPLS